MRKNLSGGGLLVAMVTCAFFASAQIKLPAVFSDGMVLQQQQKVALWGWASAGEEINITASWNAGKSVTTKAGADSKWKTTLQTPAAGGPYTISFRGKNAIELKDVLVGEVWLCSGQSNMGMTVKAADGAKEEIPIAAFPTLRYFSIKRQYGPKEFDDAPGSEWVKASPQTVGGFSAVAYYFAKKLQREKGVPVGLIFNAWGGTPAEAWTPSDVIHSDTILQRYLQRWDFIQTNVGRDSVAYHKALDEWQAKQKAPDSSKYKKPAEPQTLYYFNRPWREPSVLFNGLVSPVIPYGIRGVLWYQGESNVGYADEYELLFGKMIASWRKRWADAGGPKDFPFYFVQLPPNGYSDLEAAGIVRQAQEAVSKKMKNTAMAVTTDLGNMADIHPTKKKEVGERLAALALKNIYGVKGLDVSAPLPAKLVMQDNSLLLTFDRDISTFNEQPAGGFEIGYQQADSIVYNPAQVQVEGKKNIKILRTGGATPVAVRYAWLETGKANIGGTNGLPVAPFVQQLKP